MSTLELLASVVPAVAASSAGGALVGSTLNGWWSRRAAKKVPKTEKRVKAYEDFVIYFATASSSDLDLPSVKARLLLYGESAVVTAAADFLSNHSALGNSKANGAFLRVVREMRASLLTGDGSRVMESIEKILSPSQHEA